MIAVAHHRLKTVAWLMLGLCMAAYIATSPLRVVTRFDTFYYWLWSHHLAWSYLDGPPLIAYLIKVSTMLFGDRAMAINMLYPMTMLVSVGFYYKTARLLYNPTVSVISTCFLVASPIGFLLSRLMTNDLALFMTTVMTGYYVSAYLVTQKDAMLYGASISAALMMLSKYQGVVFLMGVFAFVMLHKPLRAQLFHRRHFWLSLLFFLVLLIPLLIWNMQHQWLSLQFLWGIHRVPLSAANLLHHVFAFLRMYVWDYGYGVPIALCVWRYVSERSHSDDFALQKLYLTCSLVFFLFWFAISMKGRFQSNYLIPAWPALLLLSTHTAQQLKHKQIGFLLFALLMLYAVLRPLKTLFPSYQSYREKGYQAFCTQAKVLTASLPKHSTILLDGSWFAMSSLLMFCLHDRFVIRLTNQIAEKRLQLIFQNDDAFKRLPPNQSMVYFSYYFNKQPWLKRPFKDFRQIDSRVINGKTYYKADYALWRVVTR